MRITGSAALIALASAALLLSGCSDNPTTATLTGHAVRDSMMVGDTMRTFWLYLPAAVDTSDVDLPLLVALHDANSTGGAFASLSDLDQFADAFGFYVVFPDAVAADWAVGCDCTEADMAGVNDTGFVRSLVQKVDDENGVDRIRVYAAGYSEGGQFSWRLACEMSDEFAGVASVVGAMPYNLSQACNPTDAVAVLNIQGTEDDVFPYEGGGTGVDSVLAAVEPVEFWAGINSCTAADSTSAEDYYDDGTYLYVIRHHPCDSGMEATLLQVTGGIHTWWMSAEFNTALTISAYLLAFQR